jgi:NADH-quinone oxidoreductase subunit H
VAALEAMRIEVPEEVDPFAGGFPVPALPGQRLVRTNGRPGGRAAGAGAAGAGVVDAPQPGTWVTSPGDDAESGSAALESGEVDRG